MYKSLAVVAFSLIVLTGAMGLRNIAVANAATSTVSSFTMQGRPFPPPCKSCMVPGKSAVLLTNGQ